MRSLALFLVLACAGCGGHEGIDIAFKPAAPVAPVAGAEAVTLAVRAEDAHAGYLEPLSETPSTLGIGAAPILADNNLALTLQRAVAQELVQRGFRVGAKGVTVEVSLRHFYNDFDTGVLADDAVAKFDAIVTVRSRGGELFLEQPYLAEGVERGIELPDAGNARAALVKALAAGVQEIVDDPDFIAAIFRAQAADKAAPAS